MFYSLDTTRLTVTAAALALLIAASPGASRAAQKPTALPGTAPLDWPEVEYAAIADRLMDGAHRFVERQIQQAVDRRGGFWKLDFSGEAEYQASIAADRSEFARLIGVVDRRLPVVMETFGGEENPSLVAEQENYRVEQVRWSVLSGGEGVWGEGLLIRPRATPSGYAVVVPDAGQTPEQSMGLAPGIDPPSRIARRLAERGFMVVVPTLINRQSLDPAALDLPEEAARRLARYPDQTYREWLYRQSYPMGRHLIGYEVQKVLAAVEWLKRRGGPKARVGVVGTGDGGLIAFHAAALDRSVQTVLVSGYFRSREETWREPLDRNIWSLLERFGDAELATLVAPRDLVIEHSHVTEITGPKGESRTPDFEAVLWEFERINTLLPRGFQSRSLIHGHGGAPVAPGSNEGLAAFTRHLSGTETDFGDAQVAAPLIPDRRRAFDPDVRHLRQVRQIQEHVQRLIRFASGERDRFYGHQVLPALADTTWSTQVMHETHPLEPFVEGSRRFRTYFLEEVQGRFDEPLLSPNPRTRLIYETQHWVGYDVILDVFPDLVAWGVLLIPNDLRPEERRPVVVVQHGRNGLPEDLIVKDHPSYRRVAARLAERGFITFVPHNLYRTESRYRVLNRKANSVKATLYSFLFHQHDQILLWLRSLEFVDGDRIGFYGNSFGGETALRVPPLLEGYALSICASYFNQWTRKLAATDYPFSYLFTDEWEVPVFNVGHTFDHAELAYLMVPRPFMVERGHHDHVASDEWVAHEYARVRRLYSMLGIADRTAIEFFQGGHGMRLEATLRFLHNHLDWPERKAEGVPVQEIWPPTE